MSKVEKAQSRKENTELVSLVDKLKKEKKEVWKKVVKELLAPRRSRAEINISKLEQLCSDGAVVLVPGKVLGAGNLSKKLTVAALSFSQSARKLIDESGSKAISIDELYKSHPDGKGVVIVK